LYFRDKKVVGVFVRFRAPLHAEVSSMNFALEPAAGGFIEMAA
jgi:hypothetical protein